MPGLLLPSSSPKKASKQSTAWSFSFRGGYNSDSSDSGDEEEEEEESGRGREAGNSPKEKEKLSEDAKLLKELDIASRAEMDAAQFKANPWSIARINAASRATNSNSNTGEQSHGGKTSPVQKGPSSAHPKAVSRIGHQTTRPSVPPAKKHVHVHPRPGKTKPKPDATIQRFLSAKSELTCTSGRREHAAVSGSMSTSNTNSLSDELTSATPCRSDLIITDLDSCASDSISIHPATQNTNDSTKSSINPATDSILTTELQVPDVPPINDNSNAPVSDAICTSPDEPDIYPFADQQDRDLASFIDDGASFVGPDEITNTPTHPKLNSVNAQGWSPKMLGMLPFCMARYMKLTNDPLQGIYQVRTMQGARIHMSGTDSGMTSLSRLLYVLCKLPLHLTAWLSPLPLK